MGRIKKSFPARLLSAYGSSHAGNYASALALNSFMTMFPLILGIISLIGLVITDKATLDHIEGIVASVFPGDARPQVLQALHGVQQHAGILGAISIVGLLWSGTSLFSSMEFSLTEIFGGKQRDMLRQRAMGLVMMIVFLLAVMVAVVGNSAAAASTAGGIIGSIAGAVAMFLLLLAIYRWVPNRTFKTRDLWPGALLAGILIEVFTLLFPLYAKVMHGFNTYGQQFALFFLIATWLIFLSQFILLGAVLNRMRLGPPSDEGIVSSKGVDARDTKTPVEAIEEEQAKAGELKGQRRGQPQPAGAGPSR